MEEKVNELTNERKLATIAKILKVETIPDADNIETVYVRGWRCVAKKGEFKEGDLCVYAEVDSVFPDGLSEEKAAEWKTLQRELSKVATEDDKLRIKAAMEEISKLNTIPQFEFLRGSKFRIKTKRIFGEISQGICFPLSILEKEHFSLYTKEGTHYALVERNDNFMYNHFLDEGFDVTKLLGVTQYIAPDPAIMGGDAKGEMQSIGLLISDEERIENLSGKYETMKQFTYYKTEKLEGTSFTCYIKNGLFGVTGRTIEFKVPEPEANINTLNVYWKVARKFDMENKLRDFLAHFPSFPPMNIALQGELIGEGIQGNIYNIKGQKVMFYNAFDIDMQRYWSYDAFVDLITKSMGLETVPIIDTMYRLPENAIDLLKEADITYSVLNPKQLIEGFVYIANETIPQGVRVTRANFNRLSFKAKSRTYDMNKK